MPFISIGDMLDDKFACLKGLFMRRGSGMFLYMAFLALYSHVKAQ
jgi:hypothetical protein